ncbi:hypothetical protein OHC33_010852 [Knufia fluminis]|uniref:Caib baif family enzyme n=1 Tax=Knufia fluminis TaxID=191047 RepID=A0AAN8E7Q8_9EURO|nr:hypothetical protein OHC33_010852 [Knufia fluminis]
MPALLNGTATGASPISAEAATKQPLCQIITPVGMLGYGFVDAHVEAELERLSSLSTPTAIILDSGSTDSGPSKLALGTMSCPRASYERDMHKLIKLNRKYNVPVLIGSAGGDGADEHVDVLLDIIKEHSEEPENSDWNLKVLAIYAGVPHGLVSERLKAGRIEGCGQFVPQLTQETVDQTVRIVAQMGPEPYLDAMLANQDFDIIIGGRAYDPAPYIAFAAYHARQKGCTSGIEVMRSLSEAEVGAFAHMGKIMECGGACATPKSNASAALVYQDATFDILPLDPASRCIPRSVAAHVMYENARPDVLYGPGGYMDLTKTTFEQLDDGKTVRVAGALFKTSESLGQNYTVKLEGARVCGFRTVFVGSYRDPILIRQLGTLFPKIKQYVKMQHKHVKEAYDVDFHVYGLNPDGVTTNSANGIFVVCEALADSQKVANSVASTARIACIHASYEGQKANAGNFGFGHGGKFDFEANECTEFSLYHLMALDEGEAGANYAASHEEGMAQRTDGQALFHWTVSTIGTGEGTQEQPTGNGTHSNGFTNGDNSTPAAPPTTPQPLALPADIRYLRDIANIIRSKNAGPYEITVDIIFDSQAIYELVKSSGLLSSEYIARLYGIPSEQIVWSGFFDTALAFKVTFPRLRNGKPVATGGFMESDVHGSQLHVELLDLELDEELISKIRGLQK